MTQGGAVARAGTAALVGRQAELDMLAGAFRAAQAGRGKIVLIRGEPGIGKTAMLGYVADQAAAAGARVASGAAEELEQRVPFAAITDCLRLIAAAGGRAAEILALLHGAHRVSGGALAAGDAEFVIAEAILGLVDAWCAAGVVVLAVDDLQWADPASLLVLHRLGRVAGQLPLLLAGARRSGAAGTELERLERSWEARGAELLPLSGLDQPAVSTLTAQVVGTQPAAGLLDRMAAAAGNPLYVIELARALAGDGRQRGRTAGSSPDPVTDGAAIPQSLLAVVTRRLSALSARAREILPMAAILGPNFTVAELSAVLARPALEFLGVIQEAATAGILTAESDRLAFRHDVIRHALQESLPASARSALHLQAGQALASAGAPAERVARHLLAGPDIDVRTLRWLAGSADRLSARAPELATDLLRRALDLADPTGDLVGRLRLGLANALLRAARFEEAETVAAQALAADPEGDSVGLLRWILVQSSLNQGRIVAALAEARRAIDSKNISRAECARFHGVAAQCLHVLSPAGPGPAMQAAEVARDEGLASGDAHAMAYGLQAVAGASRWQGRFGQALDLADQSADALARAGPIIDSQLDPHLIRANCLFDLDRDQEAREAYAADLRLAEGVGTFFLCFHHLSVARLCFLTGRWDDSLAEIRTARGVPDHLGLIVHLDGLAALIAVHRQDREAFRRLRALDDQPLASGTTRHTYDDRAWGRALLAAADGDQAAAFRVLADAWRQCVAGQREYCGHYLLPDLAGLAGPPGEQETARRAVAELHRYAADREVPALRRSARFAAGILDRDAGTLLRVADAYAAARRPLREAQAREEAAATLATAGNIAEARRQLDTAQDRYARLDATWDAARADARLRACGIRRGAHGRRRRPKAGWAALTETEQKVAALLAEGLSNPDIASRMFTSRRTVQFHVSNILAKLGLSSRVELATLVARRA